jgi:hypothetical protein
LDQLDGPFLGSRVVLLALVAFEIRCEGNGDLLSEKMQQFKKSNSCFKARRLPRAKRVDGTILGHRTPTDCAKQQGLPIVTQRDLATLNRGQRLRWSLRQPFLPLTGHGACSPNVELIHAKRRAEQKIDQLFLE